MTDRDPLAVDRIARVAEGALRATLDGNPVVAHRFDALTHDDLVKLSLATKNLSEIAWATAQRRLAART